MSLLQKLMPLFEYFLNIANKTAKKLSLKGNYLILLGYDAK